MFRKTKFTFLICLFLFSNVVFIAHSQETANSCDIESINQRIADAIENYNQAQSNATNSDELLSLAEDLQNEIERIISDCENTTQVSTPTPTPTPRRVNMGRGTMAEPFAFNLLAPSQAGFDLAVRGFVRPGTDIIMNENMFNERPNADEEYVIVNVEISCSVSNNDSCETKYWDYQLVGNRGIIYDAELVVFDDLLDVNLLPGTTLSGSLPFIVKRDDDDFKLVFNEWLGDGPIRFYLAQPSLDNGLSITSNQTINVRSGPSRNFDVVNRLEANTPTIAFGRNTDATWLQISTGWVFADLVIIEGDKNILPITSQ